MPVYFFRCEDWGEEKLEWDEKELVTLKAADLVLV